MGITPITEIVIQQIISVASSPTRTLLVARIRIGKATANPIATPVTALLTSFWKIKHKIKHYFSSRKLLSSCF